MKPRLTDFTHPLLSLLICFSLGSNLFSPTNSLAQQTNSPIVENRSLAELELEMTNAFHKVAAIVCKPVRAFARSTSFKVPEFKGGWFHEGATKPDFINVDVRQSQEFFTDKVKGKYVSSDLNPKIMFLTEDIEFNAMTKFFYTNRSLPKRKLTEAEMIEINDLYRVIGKCERAIIKLQNPIPKGVPDEATEHEALEQDQPLAGIRAIPQEQRILYGAIAAGALVLTIIALRFFRKKPR